MTMPPRDATLLAYPFRVFFVLTGLFAGASMLGWIAWLLGWGWLPSGVSPNLWHAHEMLFGFVPAAIAGFLLTAMTNWTGAPPLRGLSLLLLATLWLAARVAMWLADELPYGLAAGLDVVFLLVLAAYVGRILYRAGQASRNGFLVAILAVLTAINLGMHLQLAGYGAGPARLWAGLALDVIAVLMVVIGGRITPAFTANWLRMRGMDPGLVRRSTTLDWAAFVSTAALIPADLIHGWPAVAGAVALLAAAVNGIRLGGWAGFRTIPEPLLWILHLGYAWIVVALALKGLAAFAGPAVGSTWVHAMGAGAIGTLVLGVMTRVALGHTGRPLRLPRGAAVLYGLVTLAALVRIAVPWLPPEAYLPALLVSGLAWVAAFFGFTIVYWPILSRPRVDGRPG